MRPRNTSKLVDNASSERSLLSKVLPPLPHSSCCSCCLHSSTANAYDLGSGATYGGDGAVLIDRPSAYYTFRQHDRTEAIVTQQRNLAVKSGSARAAIKSRQAAGETVIEYTRVRVRVCVCSETHRCSRMLASKTLAAACSPSCSSRLVHASW
jgi:hypothetical protein